MCVSKTSYRIICSHTAQLQTDQLAHDDLVGECLVDSILRVEIGSLVANTVSREYNQKAVQMKTDHIITEPDFARKMDAENVFPSSLLQFN